jgi:hypothetical protein
MDSIGGIRSGSLRPSQVLGATNEITVTDNGDGTITLSVASALNPVIVKGAIDCSGNPNYPAADAGHLYYVSVAGKIGGASGTVVTALDIAICLVDGTVAGTQAAVGASWLVGQSNIDLTNISITGGAISGTNVTVGAGKTLDVSAGTLTLADNQISGDKVEGGTINAITINTMTGNLILSDAGKITLDIAPDSDHTATGIIASYTAGENLVFGNLCYLKSDGKWWKSDADAAATMPGMKMAIATISADASGLFLCWGVARDDSWSWTIGGMIYASTDGGGLTQTAPSGDGDQIQIVGKAKSATTIFFHPTEIVTEIGLDIVDLGTATPTTITFAEMTAVPKTWMANHSSDQTVTFDAPVAADVGKQFRIVKNGTGAGKVIVDAPAGVTIEDSADGGTCYCDASARASMLFLVTSATTIQKLGGTGNWTTT